MSCSTVKVNEPQNLPTDPVLAVDTDNGSDPKQLNAQRPEKSIIRNLEIDTALAFGIWAQDPDGPHADFWFTSESFYLVDYDGDGAMPYILDKNEITIYYTDFIEQAIITETSIDTLKIKWAEYEAVTTYVRFKN